MQSARPWGALGRSAMVMVLSAGCASVPKRNPVPEALSLTAEIPGIPNARIWGDERPPHIDAWLNAGDAEIQSRFPGITGRPHAYLALSGGGPFGAFGAGLLNGWTEHGDRPEFTIVTGISAGGLAAPFAFLGPDYDAHLREIFTQFDTDEIIRKRNVVSILRSDAATDSSPLKSLIARYVDREVMQAIAAEFRKGRRLWIGTTNLDAERPVVWNIGEIAASGAPGSLELIHSILLATASIPAVFPPVLIDAEADGERFDEIHVDGGAVSMIFSYPTALEWSDIARKLDVQGLPELYLIQNFYVEPDWEAVRPRIVEIAVRGMFSMMRAQGVGDLYRIYSQTQRDGLNFNLAHIPTSFREAPEEIFDPVFMTRLFELGFGMGKAGYPWKHTPPGMGPD